MPTRTLVYLAAFGGLYSYVLHELTPLPLVIRTMLAAIAAFLTARGLGFPFSR